MIGDHGVSQVFLWSSARIGGVPVEALLKKRNETLEALRREVERDVRYANITIIEGHDASQYGIGIVSARIAEMVLRDERAVVPIGSLQKEFGVTLSLPSVVGAGGVTEVLPPELSAEERDGLAEKRRQSSGGAQARERARAVGGLIFSRLTPTDRPAVPTGICRDFRTRCRSLPDAAPRS